MGCSMHRRCMQATSCSKIEAHVSFHNEGTHHSLSLGHSYLQSAQSTAEEG